MSLGACSTSLVFEWIWLQMTEAVCCRHVSGSLTLAYRGLYIYFFTFFGLRSCVTAVLPPFHLVTTPEQPWDVTTAGVPAGWRQPCRLYQLMPSATQPRCEPFLQRQEARWALQPPAQHQQKKYTSVHFVENKHLLVRKM